MLNRGHICSILCHQCGDLEKETDKKGHGPWHAAHAATNADTKPSFACHVSRIRAHDVLILDAASYAPSLASCVWRINAILGLIAHTTSLAWFLAPLLVLQGSKYVEE
jgi:hypothetical protein